MLTAIVFLKNIHDNILTMVARNFQHSKTEITQYYLMIPLGAKVILVSVRLMLTKQLLSRSIAFSL